MYKKLLITGILILYSCLITVASGSKSDSLFLALKNAEDTAKIDILNDLCWELRNSNPSKAAKFGETAIRLADSLHYQQGKLQAMSFTGVCYRNQGNYLKALNYYFDALQIAQDIDNKEQEGYARINIANTYIYQKKYEEALVFLHQAAKIAKTINNNRMLGYSYLNTGRVYTHLGDFDQAISYLEKTLKIRKDLNHHSGEAVTLKYIGDVYFEKENYTKAKNNYFEALKISKKIKSDFDLMSDIQNKIALTYLNTGKLDLAEEHAFQSLYLADKVGTKLRIKEANYTISLIASQKGNFEEALIYYRLSTIYKDSLFNELKAKQIAELQTKYESEQRQKELEIKELELEKKQAEIDRQKILLISFIIGLAILLAFTGILFKQNRMIQKANAALAEKNEKIETQKHEIELQRDIATKQKQNITDSIQYAKNIQSALLTPKNYINEFLHDYFILYKPRDIVSGDYYWLHQKEDAIIVIAADCTGHGVPGAFMSMLGITFLTEIVNKFAEKCPKDIPFGDFIKASDILNELRDYVIRSLHQTGEKVHTKDGIDLSLCIINHRKNELQFAGANNSGILIKNNTQNDENKDIIKLKADRMPIGIYFKKNTPFSNHIHQINTGDLIYLFSDGYIDQFGGKDNRKFMARPFKELLYEIHTKPLSQQKELLNEHFEKWKGNNEQIDDILIMGIKL